ncbi:NERD domain-containing protein [Evansella sp. LMS18]|uniref:nuclease-related domain-containing protein n=1 Tax=Evansella sp. LMS18 TaxID=2924033 RepID=UPI0020D176E3|nr:nuclease-related domain-containing protein [Evansella sp. LMS18]UTR09268.1 NERD domain-containing protein [Evansella sp. LMS18]
MKPNFIKLRTEPPVLALLKLLRSRFLLPEETNDYYFSKLKGYEGECYLDSLLATLTSNSLILCDLLLEQNNTTFQIDTLLLSQKTIYLFEVKNFEGDYYIKNGDWFRKTTGKAITNPFHQLKRCETLLRSLLHARNIKMAIEPYLVFTNPLFTLYQTPLDLPAFFPGQLNYLLKKLNQAPSELNGSHQQLTQFLLSRHVIDSPYDRLPSYKYEELQKGVTCRMCQSFKVAISKYTTKCSACGHTEENKLCILQAAKDLKLLFPDMVLTVKAIERWCDYLYSRKAIWSVLETNYQLIHKGKNSYYL